MRGWPLRAPGDASLVERVLRDDPKAFELLVSRFQGRAYAIALALGVPRASADDVVQDAFLKALEKLPELRDRERFGHWFLQIVRNSARSRLRVLRQERAADPASVPAPAGESLEEGELKDLLWRKVAELPEGIREAVYLYYHEGETARAVARSLGISRAAALKRLERGRELLRGELWECLRDSLRDMLPSAREWGRKGRQLTILLIGTATAAWGAGVGALRAAPAGSAGVGAGTIENVLLGARTMAAKRLGISIALAAGVLIGGFDLFLSRLRRTDPKSGLQWWLDPAARSSCWESGTASPGPRRVLKPRPGPIP